LIERFRTAPKNENLDSDYLWRVKLLCNGTMGFTHGYPYHVRQLAELNTNAINLWAWTRVCTRIKTRGNLFLKLLQEKNEQSANKPFSIGYVPHHHEWQTIFPNPGICAANQFLFARSY
jgi:hypothetical protein